MTQEKYTRQSFGRTTAYDASGNPLPEAERLEIEKGLKSILDRQMATVCPICGGNDLGCIWGLTPEEARRDREGWK